MNKALKYIWATVFVILLWWLLAALAGSPALPSPAQTLPVFIDELPDMMPAFWISLGRILLSMLIGTALGAPLGILLGRSKRADEVLGPVLYILYPLPKIVLLPILFVLFGLGGQAKIILISIAVFFQMIVTMRDAAKSIPKPTVDAMRSLGASKGQMFAHVLMPATLPDLFTALRVTTATAVAILFIAESMAGSTGLGYFIMHSWSVLEYEQMFAGIVAMAVMGVIIYEVFDLIEKKLTHSDAG